MSIRYHQNTAGYRLMYFANEYAGRQAITSYDDFRCRRFTYAQLLPLTVRTAGLLLEKGCSKGDAVMVCAENSVEYTLLIFATAVLGLRLIPVDVNTAIETMEKLHASTSPRMVFTSRRDVLERFASEDAGVLDIDMLMEESAGAPASLGELFEKHPECNWYVDENDVYILIFTSGTTSEPKAVPLTHRNITCNVQNLRKLCFIPEDDSILSMAPLSHALGLTMGLYGPLSFGARVVYIKHLNSSNIMRVMNEDHIDAVLTVPAFLSILKDKIEEELRQNGQLEKVQNALPKMLKLPMWARRFVFRKLIRKLGGDLRWVATGASALNEEVGNFWEAVGVMITQGYGMTECLILTISDFDWRRMGTVGKCLPRQEIRLDEKNEIWVAGPHVFTGYVGQDELNAQLFKDGWFRTGDLGQFDPDGHLRIVGRAKNVIIGPTGLNIYPEDIESVVMAQPEVMECVVVDMPSKKEDFYLVALIIPSSLASGNLDQEELLNRINGKLSSHQKLARLYVWHDDDFPRTPSRKVKRKTLLDELEEVKDSIRGDKASRSASEEPGDEFEAAVVRLVASARKIGARDVSTSDRLIADLGFDSLAMAELVMTLEERMGVEITDDELFSIDLSIEEFIERIRPAEGEGRGESDTLHVPAPMRALLSMSRATSRLFLPALFKMLFRLEIENRQVRDRIVVPGMRKRGHVIVANHNSHLDGMSIFCALPFSVRSRLVAAAAHDYFFSPGNGKHHAMLNSFLRAFPVKRKANPRAYFSSIGRFLDGGDSVLIFPEGKRSRTGDLNPFAPSVGQCIRLMDAPVVPLVIHGTRDLWPPGQDRPKRGNLKVTFHEPIHFSGRLGAYEIRDHLEDLFSSELG